MMMIISMFDVRGIEILIFCFFMFFKLEVEFSVENWWCDRLMEYGLFELDEV